jgi:hypothetical protein
MSSLFLCAAFIAWNFFYITILRAEEKSANMVPLLKIRSLFTNLDVEENVSFLVYDRRNSMYNRNWNNGSGVQNIISFCHPSNWLLLLNPDSRFQEYNALSICTNVSKEFAPSIFRVKELREEVTIPCLYRVIKKSMCTWWLQYRRLQVMFKVYPASLQAFIDAPNCVLEDRVQYSMVHIPNVFCDGNLFCVFLYCNHQMHRDFLITLYNQHFQFLNPII